MSRISIHVVTRERPSEIAILIQALRTQTFKDWDLIIIDESQQNKLKTNHFVQCLIGRIKYEGHCVQVFENDLPLGVCQARNLAIDKDYFKNDFICRLDDDVVPEPDYLEKLMEVINQGYDIASGVTPTIYNVPFERSVSKVKPIINKKEFDKEGNLVHNGDDCGFIYQESEILPANGFRSCALFKSEIFDKVRYEKNLSPVGFREECFFSLRAQWVGYKIGVHTQALVWHILTRSGGCRFPDYPQKVQSDDKYFRKWCKEMYLKNGKFDSSSSGTG